MTRTTSFAMPKRHHLASSSFEEMKEQSGSFNQAGPSNSKKRNRDEGGNGEKEARDGGERRAGQGWARDPKLIQRAQQSENRRLDRQNTRTSDTVCFACRSKGHSARECPNVLLAAQDDPSTLDSERPQGMKRKKGKMGADVAGQGGRCYRCDSSEHPLSRCPKPKSVGLPFATCFICLSQGHLASTCPQSTRGIYPNGGSCKVCNSVQHRANDCPDDKWGGGGRADSGILAELEAVPQAKLREGDEELLSSSAIGTGRDVGADEDDFMGAKRRKDVVDRINETRKAEEKKRKMAIKEIRKKSTKDVVDRGRPLPALDAEESGLGDLLPEAKESKASKPSEAVSKSDSTSVVAPPVAAAAAAVVPKKSTVKKTALPPRGKPKVVSF